MAFDVKGLLEQAQSLGQQLAATQEAMGARTVEATAGGGLVSVTVNGRLEVQSVRIDATLLESPDRDMLQDLLVAAVNQGIRAAQQMIATEMGKVTGGLGLKLPGMG